MGRVYDATWGRLFAAVYDRSLKSTEEAGLGQMRRELLAGARGRVVEIGAGTGVNLDLYPEGVESLALVEPDPHMAKRLRAHLSESSRAAEIVEAPAERLPFDERQLRHRGRHARPLHGARPGGRRRRAGAGAEARRAAAVHRARRAADAHTARWQDRLEKPWRFLGDGCHCNRDTLATLAASRFDLDAVEHGRMPKAPSIVRPLIRGSAVLA